MESYTKFFCSEEAWNDPWKKNKLQNLTLLLQAAYDAESQVLLKLNVSAESLDAVRDLLPALHAPTVNPLTEEGWYAVETVVNESTVREIIPSLKKAGAEGILSLIHI